MKINSMFQVQGDATTNKAENGGIEGPIVKCSNGQSFTFISISGCKNYFSMKNIFMRNVYRVNAS